MAFGPLPVARRSTCEACRGGLALVMTAAPQPEIRDEAFQLGANEFIAKPFKLEVIIRIVQQFVTPP